MALFVQEFFRAESVLFHQFEDNEPAREKRLHNRPTRCMLERGVIKIEGSEI